jgi:hypothetical protein
VLHPATAVAALKKEGVAQIIRAIHKYISIVAIAGFALAKNFTLGIRL